MTAGNELENCEKALMQQEQPCYTQACSDLDENMLYHLNRITYYPSRFLLKLLYRINPRCRLLWATIGEKVILGRNARISSSRDIALGNRAWIEDHATLAPMGGTISIGDDTHILSYAMLMCYGGDISLGSYCTVHPFSILYGGGGLKIGDSVRIAAHTVVASSNHVFEDPKIPIRLQGTRSKGIVIESDVWIGAGGRILDGVTIGQGSIVGAGAVVTRNVPDYAIVTGVPARVTAWRKHEQKVSTA